MKHQDSLSSCVPCKHTEPTAARPSDHLLTTQTSKKVTRHLGPRVAAHRSAPTAALVPALRHRPQPNTDQAQPEADARAHTAPSGDRSSGFHCLLWFALCTGALFLFIFWELPFPFFSVIKSKAKFFFFFLKEFLKIVSLEECDKTNFKQKSQKRQNAYILDIMLRDLF